MAEYLYAKKNPSFFEIFKGGYTTNPFKRIASGDTEHLYPSEYYILIEVIKTENYQLGIKECDRIIFDYSKKEETICIIEDMYKCKLPLLRELSKYLLDKGGGTEFISNEGIDLYKRVILEEFPKLGLETREIPSDEIEIINLKCKEERKNKYNYSVSSLISARNKKVKRDRQSIKDEIKWIERQYQKDIIVNGLEKMNEVGKFYLELATGGGKTYIVFSILKQLNPDIIFMMSPRLKINKQNIDGKYKSFIGKEYSVFNISEDNNLNEFMRKEGKKIIVGCTVNNKKIKDIIDKYNIIDSLIWFDEAHNGVEKWDIEQDPDKKFLLTSPLIKYRIFTSASPDKSIVEQNENIFGKLYSPIKVKELIELKYLCPIIPRMLFINLDSVNTLNLELDSFKDTDRSWGLSFHNEQKNAFELFYKHYILYKNNETDIRPYLIVGDDFKDTRMDRLELDYEFKSIVNYQENINSISYTVKMLDMGYDFWGIDYIIFSDRKMSYKDIIQCIGRGIRSDGKHVDENGNKTGKNKDKELILMLPSYIEDEENDKYKHVIEILRYLIMDIGIPVEKIMEPKYSGSSGGNKESRGEGYDGENTCKTKIIDLLQSGSIIKPLNAKTLVTFCNRNNIYSQEDYNSYKKEHPYLNLKDNIYDYKDFKWKPVLDPNSEIYYSSIKECEEKKKELIRKLEKENSEEEMEEIYEDETDEGFKYLNKLDPKFPPYIDLKYFY